MLTKIQEQLVADLYSPNEPIVLKAIEELREHGNEKTLESLIQLLCATSSELIRIELIKYLNELKSDKALPPLIEAIANPKYHVFQVELIAAIWESGLDASDYLEFFIDLIIEQDYLVGIEAITVIENILAAIEKTVAERNIVKIESALLTTETIKEALLKSLIGLINSKTKEN